MGTTPETITDKQIQALRNEAAVAGDEFMVDICDAALDHEGNYLGHSRREWVDAARVAARAECARVIAEAEAQS